MLLCHPSLHKIYLIAIDKHENSSVDTLLEIQSQSVIVWNCIFGNRANLHI